MPDTDYATAFFEATVWCAAARGGVFVPAQPSWRSGWKLATNPSLTQSSSKTRHLTRWERFEPQKFPELRRSACFILRLLRCSKSPRFPAAPNR